MPGIVVIFLDVSVDVAPLLAVARAIRERLAKEWVDRLVRTLLRERPLACTLSPTAEQLVRGILQERGIATDAWRYYAWYAIHTLLQEAIVRRIDLHNRPVYEDLYEMLEEGVPGLQRFRRSWPGRLRLELERHIKDVSVSH